MKFSTALTSCALLAGAAIAIPITGESNPANSVDAPAEVLKQPETVTLSESQLENDAVIKVRDVEPEQHEEVRNLADQVTEPEKLAQDLHGPQKGHKDFANALKCLFTFGTKCPKKEKIKEKIVEVEVDKDGNRVDKKDKKKD